eukprot:4439103-Amphidinium_carterae.1
MNSFKLRSVAKGFGSSFGPDATSIAAPVQKPQNRNLPNHKLTEALPNPRIDAKPCDETTYQNKC